MLHIEPAIKLTARLERDPAVLAHAPGRLRRRDRNLDGPGLEEWHGESIGAHRRRRSLTVRRKHARQGRTDQIIECAQRSLRALADGDGRAVARGEYARHRGLATRIDLHFAARAQFDRALEPVRVRHEADLHEHAIEEPQLIAKILSHLERAAPEQSQSELPLGARGPPAQPSLP